MRPDRDGPDAGASAAVRDAERLVQVQVRHVAAELARPGEPDERVEVRTVDVHLSTSGMYEGACLPDVLFEHPVRGRVGDHDRRDPRAVLRQLGAQVVELDRPVVGRGDHDDAQTRERRGRRIGAVRRCGDQTHVTVDVVGPRDRPQVAADRQQPGELALRTGVRLHRDRGVPGDLGEPGREGVDQLGVPGGLRARGVRVDRGELGPGDWLHLGRRVELHGARAERDHRTVQREVQV